MYAVYVLACTVPLKMFSLQCNLSKPDMPSLNQCGKLLNTMCFKQRAVVPVGKRMKHTVILAAALRHMHLWVIKSQNTAGYSFTTTIPLSYGSSKGPKMRCCNISCLHLKTQTREKRGHTMPDGHSTSGASSCPSSNCAISCCSF